MAIGTYRRYTPAQREEVRKQIWNLSKVGLTSEEIATKLIQKGIKTPNGKNPTHSFVANQMTCIRRQHRRRRGPRRGRPRKDDRQPTLFHALSNDKIGIVRSVVFTTELTDSVKIATLKGLLSSGEGKETIQ